MTRVEEAERQLANVDAASASTLFLIGLGRGCVLDILERQSWAGRVVAFEPNPTGEALPDRRDCQTWLTSGRLTILLGPSYDGLDAVTPTLDPNRPEPVIVVDLDVAAACPEAAKEAVRIAARTWFGARANQEARRQNAGRYLLNSLRNVRAITSEGDAAALTGLFAGVPALVVAAGPSLDRNLTDIIAYRDRVLLIAVDTALRPLLAAGVQPDLVAALDPSEANACHLVDLPPCPETYLVAEGSLDPEALRHFAGRAFIFRVADHHPWPWLRSLGIDRGRLRAWGSVLTTAFDLALTMGCDPIVFAGADLAFTGGQPYARGTTNEEDWRREQASGQTLEEIWAGRLNAWPEMFETGVNDAPVRTAPHLRSFRDWIATEASRATDRTIVNGTDGGILVGPHIRNQLLATALSPLRVLDPAGRGRVATAHHAGANEPARLDRGECSASTFKSWCDFAGSALTSDDVMRALGRTDLRLQSSAVGTSDSALTAAASATPFGEEQAAISHGSGKPDSGLVVTLECTETGAILSSRIEAAWSRVPTGGRLVLIDRTGTAGGEAVRRALFAFLERHANVRSRYGRFFDPHSEISWIENGPATAESAGVDLDKFIPNHASVAARLTSLLVERLRPESMLDIGCGAGHWLRAFEQHGVSDVQGVEDRALLAAAPGTTIVPGVTGVDFAAFRPTRRVDLCLCLGVLQRVPAQTAEAIVAASTRVSDTVVFSAPAPGNGAAGSMNARPWVVWHRLFWSHGFAACDELRPLIEERWGRYSSAYDLLVVYRRVTAEHNRALPSAAMESAVLGAAQRIDDQILQGHWYSLALNVPVKPAPRLQYDRLEIEPARMQAVGATSARAFSFRTSGALLALAADGIEMPIVEENGRPLARMKTTERIRTGQSGLFAIEDGTVTFSSFDGRDPRHNGRAYAIRVPAHVAWLERLPIATILEHQL